MIPALVALALYSVFALVIAPLVRQHRHRYDQYLPVHSASQSLSTGTSSLRDRVGNMLSACVMPSFHGSSDRVVDGTLRRQYSGDESDTFGIEDAEDMVGFDVRDVSRRREELRRHVDGMECATRLSGSTLSHEQDYMPSDPMCRS